MSLLALEPEIARWIEAYGQHYKSVVCPPDIIRGEPGTCFDTSLLAAMKSHGKYRYVEGIAIRPLPGLGKTWILHAWLTDNSGAAYDPTWRAYNNRTGKETPVPTHYIGIEIPTLSAMRFVHQTTFAGVMPNHFRAPAAWAEILKEIAKKWPGHIAKP